MIWFEWKKIFERRLNQFAMLAGYILIGVCVFFYISQVRIYDLEAETYIEGLEAVRLSQERAEGQTDVISEEYITKLIGDIQRIGVDLGTDESYEKIARPLGDIYYFIVKNYTDMRESSLDEKALGVLATADRAHISAQRMTQIPDYLNLDLSYGSSQASEKEYWIQKAEDIVMPFKLGRQKCDEYFMVCYYAWILSGICGYDLHESCFFLRA